MEVSETHRFARVTPRKARLVLEHLPGHSIEEALNLLKFLPTPHARVVAKIVKSAASNAENNFSLDPDSLYVKRAVAGDARRMPRARPASRGRVTRVTRHSSHITITVDQREN